MAGKEKCNSLGSDAGVPGNPEPLQGLELSETKHKVCEEDSWVGISAKERALRL